MTSRRPTPRHRLLAALAALGLGACAAGELPTAGEADAGEDAGQLAARTQAPPQGDAPDENEVPWADAGTEDPGAVGPDAAPPGEASPPEPASPSPATDSPPAMATQPPAAPAPATEAPAPATEPPAAPPAPVCVAEVCNGLDDDCDGTIDEDAACPCDVTARNGRAYLICGQTMGWFAARNICHSVGYDLAAINDAAEDAFLFGEMQRRGLGGAWVGLNDHVAEGAWVWLDGDPLLYTHWDSGEPNNGGGGEDCGIIMAENGRASEWDDRNCDSARPFLCELSGD